MLVAVEKVMIANFLMDVFLLLCAIRPVMRVHPARVFLAALLGASLASLVAAWNCPWTVRILSAIVSLPVMLSVSCGTFSARIILRTGAAFITAACISAAFMALLPPQTPIWISGAMSAFWAPILSSVRTKGRNIWEVRANVILAGEKCSFVSLIDTGNRLKEPVSGLDVMIVSGNRISSMLPEGFDPSEPWRTLPDGFRLVSYGGVGGSGELACFMPDDLVFDLSGRIISKKEQIWIAVYPRPLPGRVEALAPPSVLQ